MSERTAINLVPIGYVERDADGLASTFASTEELRRRPARIRLAPEFAPGLLGLEPGSDIVVLYFLHESRGFALQLHPQGDRSRPVRGVFATRSPRRPNPIGLTTARVRRVSGNVLEVVGLDARDGSPVLDIKSFSSFFDEPYREEVGG